MKLAALLLVAALSPSDEWLPYNRVDLIINEECITALDVQRAMVMQGRDVSDEKELQRLFQKVNAELISWSLKVQAGKDMGFDPEMVRAFVQDGIEARLEDAKSAARMAELLQDADIDSGKYYEENEDQVHSELWTRSVQGRFQGPGGRPFVDRYVRPGRLKFEYERRKKGLSDEAEVVLQMAVASTERFGNPEECRKVLEDLLERVAAGDDFGDSAVEMGLAPEEGKGVQPAIPEENLRRLVPGIDEFLEWAGPGDLSEVTPRRREGTLIGFWVFRLVERQKVEAPSFVDEELQKTLVTKIQTELDRGREDAALNYLLQSAYVWPPESFGRKPGAGEPAGPPRPPEPPLVGPPAPPAAPTGEAPAADGPAAGEAEAGEEADPEGPVEGPPEPEPEPEGN